MRDVDTSYAIRKGGVCVTHGAVGNKRCSHKGCTYSARKGGVCVTHGAVVSRCSHKGCIKSARNGGVCTTHGAERKRCSHEGCPNQVVKGGVCITHGATKKRKRCSHKGCTNHVVKMEECVSLMAHRNRSENVVATRDVQTKPKRVKFVSRMEPRPRYSSAAAGDVPPMSEKEEFVTNIPRKVVSTQSPTRRFKQTLMSLLSFRLVNQLIMRRRRRRRRRRNLIVGFGSHLG